jgi:hypothetical protein
MRLAVHIRLGVNAKEESVKFGDYAPPTWPSLDQQRDALQKGLGRALQWAFTERLDNEPLLEACLRDQRFDASVEDSRGDWLWSMVQAVRAAGRFRVPILHALYDLSDERSAKQLCELARCYAKLGDESFRTRLYAIVEQKPFPDSLWLGEEELIALDGEQALLFAASARGRSLPERQWEWDDTRLIDLAVERFGEEHVGGLLEASSDQAVMRFVERWRVDKRKPEQQQSTSARERMAAIPVEEVVRAAEGAAMCFSLRGWGLHVDGTDLQSVLQHLWAAREPRTTANLLRIFSARALPQFDTRLIELCRCDDGEVRQRAFRALEQNAHPLVREFALKELQKGVRDGHVVALFVKNYRQGDECQILEAIELPEDECKLHWLLMDVIKVLEKNPEADCARLGVIGYALTPCENCRFYAARLLLNVEAAPEWLREECRFDSGKDSRQLVEKITRSTGQRG